MRTDKKYYRFFKYRRITLEYDTVDPCLSEMIGAELMELGYESNMDC
jgi:hypothetical protein